MNGLRGFLRKLLAAVAVGSVLVAAPIVYAGLAPVRPSIEGVDGATALPGKIEGAAADGLEVAEPGASEVVTTPSAGKMTVPVPQEPAVTDATPSKPSESAPVQRTTDRSRPGRSPSVPLAASSPPAPTEAPGSKSEPVAQPPSTLPRPAKPTLAFVSRRSGSDQVFTVAADGSELTQITFGKRTVAPTWLGPTGGLAYVRTTSGVPQGELIARSPDGRERVIVSGNAARPSSSPDGKTLVYESTENGPASQLFVVNVDGTGKRQLTNSTCSNAQPAWSPDGTKIAFSSSRGNCAKYDLYVMDADGSAQTRLTSGATAFSSGAPSWSPDSRTLVFEATRDGDAELYSMNIDGAGLARLTSNAGSYVHPTWLGDGTRIAFQSTRSGNVDIYSLKPDGSDLLRITMDPADDTAPTWRPER